jgi:hypothetical protein
MVGELNIHKQRKKTKTKNKKKDELQIELVSSSSTPITTTTHGSITLERLEHEQFRHGLMRLPGEGRKQANKQTSSSSSSNSATLKKPLRSRH